MTEPTELTERAEIRRRVRNIYGAISSNQVIDKDVEGQAKRLLEYIDALPSSEAGSEAGMTSEHKALVAELRRRAERRAQTEGPFTKENLVEWRAASAIETLSTQSAQPQACEPVAWQRRQMYSDIPGYVPEWQFVSKEEATGHFERRPGYEYRPLYAHPPQPAERVVETIRRGFTSAVHFVRNVAMDMERYYPEIIAAENALSALSQPHPADERVVGAKWPAYCAHPGTCSRHRQCMYAGCKHEGVSISADVDAALRAMEGR